MGLDPIKLNFNAKTVQRVRDAARLLDTWVERYLREMDPDMPLGINIAEDTGALVGISDYDGTSGFDPRPEFVKEDDERIEKGQA